MKSAKPRLSKPSSPPSAKNLRILVVEDNDKNRKLVRSLLNIHNYEVREAADAETGIEMATTDPPDLILMDIQLPGMDGLEAVSIIKKIPALQKINVVALTSYAMEGDCEKAMQAGCNGYITKPINTRQFIDQITPYLPHPEPDDSTTLPKEDTESPTLLIVDDEPMNLKLLHAKLKNDYSHIIEARDGKEALAIAQDTIPDLIMLDIMMPGLDGYQVTRQLKADPKTKDIPIMLITALDGHDCKVMGYEAGADDFLNKPINTAELLSRAKSLLQMKTCHDQLSVNTRTNDSSVALVPNHAYSAYPNQTIQILMDDPEQGKQVRMYLYGQGYEINEKKEFETTFDDFDANASDVLILDNYSQTTDCLELCRSIKENKDTGNCQILYVTTQGDLEVNYARFEDCIDDFLTQPINIYEIRTRVRVLLKKKMLLDQLVQSNGSTIQHVITDTLTGLYNFDYCIHVLKHEMQRTARENSVVALVMMAVDECLVSSSAGEHGIGESIMSELGTVIKKSIRKLDIAARRSDNTFTFVLPEANSKKALGFINRLHGIIRKQLPQVKATGHRADKLFSFGHAVCPDNSSEISELIQLAEKALEKQKTITTGHLAKVTQ